jgi:hypothetical protein
MILLTDLITALPGNSSVNTNTGNNRRENVFYIRWEMVFSVGSVQRSYLKDEQRYESVSSQQETAMGSS